MQFLTPNCCTVFVILHHHANIISFIFVLQLNKLKEYIYIYIYIHYIHVIKKVIYLLVSELSKSIGSGKMMVEFFSAAIELRVCR